ncbi:MAG: hypothetical protein GY769_25910 [bacterium]|nr:hypothetical protein [bacterium]
MNRRTADFAILGIGTAYLVVVSWAMSWWYVPAYRETGPVGVDGSAYGLGMTILWTTSGIVGAVVVAVGAALAAGLGRRWLLALSVTGLAVIAWLALWVVPTIHPFLFGVGGSLILLFFIGLSWRWARLRPDLSARERAAADLRMASHVFYFMAAWGLCGVLGTPLFGLSPARMQEFATQPMAITLASEIMILLVLGWGCAYLAETRGARR